MIVLIFTTNLLKNPTNGLCSILMRNPHINKELGFFKERIKESMELFTCQEVII